MHAEGAADQGAVRSPLQPQESVRLPGQVRPGQVQNEV